MKAAVYDFDGTLTPETLPYFKILEESGLKGGLGSPEFKLRIKALMASKGLDFYSAMIFTILDYVRDAGFKLTNNNISLGASERHLNPGVPEFICWLKEQGVANYMISSGAKAYLERLAIAPLFSQIYATTLSYDANGEAIGIAKLMDDEQKVVALKEIAQAINGNPENCDGVVYFGDGPTDMPVFKFVKQHGGKTVLICQDPEAESLQVFREQNLIDKFALNDYEKGSDLYNFIEKLL